MVRKKLLNKKGIISPITKTIRPEKYNGGPGNLMNLTRDYVENKKKAALKNKQLSRAGVKDILEYGPDIEVRSNKIMSVGDIIKKQGEIRLKRDSMTKRKYRRRKDFSSNNYTIKLTESELRLFSEFLEQKEFDYKKPLRINRAIAEVLEDGWDKFHDKSRNPEATNSERLKALDYESRRSFPFDPDAKDIWNDSQEYAHRRYKNVTGRDLKYDHDRKNYTYVDDSGKTVEISPEDRATLNTWELELRNRAYQQDEKFKDKTQFRKNIHDASLLYEANTGRSLGKDAAIVAGTTAALGAGAYGIHRYLKNKKKNKDEAEKKYKTSDKKKKK